MNKELIIPSCVTGCYIELNNKHNTPITIINMNSNDNPSIGKQYPPDVELKLIDSGASANCFSNGTGFYNKYTTGNAIKAANGNMAAIKCTGTVNLLDINTGTKLPLSKTNEVPKVIKDVVSWKHSLEEQGWKPSFESDVLCWTKMQGPGRIGKLKCHKQEGGMYYLAIRHLEWGGHKVPAVHANEEVWKDTTVEVEDETGLTKTPEPQKITKMDINDAHGILGHYREQQLKATLNPQGIELTGTL
jgi:hypothetical protein